MIAGKLTDEQLEKEFQTAVSFNAVVASRNFAKEMLARERQPFRNVLHIQEIPGGSAVAPDDQFGAIVEALHDRGRNDV